MERKNTFEISLSQIKQRVYLLNKRLDLLTDCIKYSEKEKQLKLAFEIEEISEQITLLTRKLPIYTGNPQAARLSEKLIKQSVPVEMGYTAEGYFVLVLPFLLPKKEHGSTDYIRAVLYPQIKDFFNGKAVYKYKNAVIIYRHVYDMGRSERRMRDHDNIEINTVSDIVALYTLPDDSPAVCSHYYCSIGGNNERTEVYVMSKSDFNEWLENKQYKDDERIILYENRM